MEEGKENKAETANPGTIPVKKHRKPRKAIQEFLGGEYLSRESVVRSVPYILYVAMLGLIYISNTYDAEKTVKEIERTKLQLKELRYQYITAKSNLMFYGKQTEIAKRAVKYGLKETIIPPYKIFYLKDSVNTGSR
jgi:hypothetical protein